MMAYPEISKYQAAAEAVIAKFPCVRDWGSKVAVDRDKSETPRQQVPR